MWPGVFANSGQHRSSSRLAPTVITCWIMVYVYIHKHAFLTAIILKYITDQCAVKKCVLISIGLEHSHGEDSRWRDIRRFITTWNLSHHVNGCLMPKLILINPWRLHLRYPHLTLNPNDRKPQNLAPVCTNNAGVPPTNDRPPFVTGRRMILWIQMWVTLPLSTQKIDVSSKKCWMRNGWKILYRNTNHPVFWMHYHVGGKKEGFV